MPAATVGLQKEDPTICRVAQTARLCLQRSLARTTLATETNISPRSTGSTNSSATYITSTPRKNPSSGLIPRTPSSARCLDPVALMRCRATDQDDATVDPRFGRVGKQVIEDTGPLTTKRMETIDDETSDAAIDYMKRRQATGEPFFVWYNSTRMHFRTHVAADRRSEPGLTAKTEYADGMIEHDGHVGKILKTIDDLGIADNTIVSLHNRQRPAHETPGPTVR